MTQKSFSTFNLKNSNIKMVELMKSGKKHRICNLIKIVKPESFKIYLFYPKYVLRFPMKSKGNSQTIERRHQIISKPGR